MSIVLDYHVPEEVDSAAWARHNQLFVCTPSIIHLIIPDHDGTCRERGYLSFESVFGQNGRASWSPATLASISARLRYGCKTGFRRAIWWPSSVSSMDRLVLLSYAGEVMVMECFASDICAERAWRRAAIADRLADICSRISCIAPGRGDDHYSLFLATSEGDLYRIPSSASASDPPSRIHVPHLQPDDAIVRLESLDGNRLIACSTLGQVFMWRTSEPGTIRLLLDDGVLQPGPILNLPDGYFIVTKFDWIYRFSPDGDLVRAIQLLDYGLPLGGVLPADEIAGRLWILGKDATCFEVSNTLDGSPCAGTPPWLDAQLLISASGMEGGGEEGSDGDAEEDGGEASDDGTVTSPGASSFSGSGVSTRPFDASLLHGVIHSHPSGRAWVVITQHRGGNLGPKSRIHMIGGLKPEGENAQASGQSFSWDDPADLPPGLVPRLTAEPPSCPTCGAPAAMARSVRPAPIVVCESNPGHLFEICVRTGDAISPPDNARQCHRCRLHFRAGSPGEDCGLCGGMLLQVLV